MYPASTFFFLTLRSQDYCDFNEQTISINISDESVAVKECEEKGEVSEREREREREREMKQE